MTNREWVTQLYFFARQFHDSHQSCLMPWPTGSEWHCLISWPGTHQSYLTSWQTGSEWHCFTYCFARQSHQSCPPHDQQYVSGTALFLCQTVLSHDEQRVSELLDFFTRHCHQSCLIPWPTECEWHCFISLSTTSPFHDQQYVSDTLLFLCQAVSSIMSHPMTNRWWVTLINFFARQAHQSCLIPCPAESE